MSVMYNGYGIVKYGWNMLSFMTGMTLLVHGGVEGVIYVCNDAKYV